MARKITFRDRCSLSLSLSPPSFPCPPVAVAFLSLATALSCLASSPAHFWSVPPNDSARRCEGKDERMQAQCVMTFPSSSLSSPTLLFFPSSFRRAYCRIKAARILLKIAEDPGGISSLQVTASSNSLLFQARFKSESRSTDLSAIRTRSRVAKQTPSSF
eukprot:3476474-Rhodomonas_salina.1